MGFVLPPLPTGDAREDLRRVVAWHRQQARVRMIGAAAIAVALAVLAVLFVVLAIAQVTA